jgi:manganese oxidase
MVRIMSPERGPDGAVWRFPALAACVIAAVAHVPVTPEHLAEVPYLGALFLALEAACLGLAVLLVLRPQRVVLLGTAALGAAAVAAYVVSRSIGLPAAADDVGDWWEPLGVLSVAAETAMVVFGLAGWRRRRPAPSGAHRAALVGATAFLAGGLSMTVLAAAAAGPMGAEEAGTAGAHGMAGMAGMHDSGASTGNEQYWDAVGGADVPSGGVTRTYYVSADEVVWDYAPTGRNQITGRPFDATAATYTVPGPQRIGSRYLKCLYREYTDGSFGHLKPRAADEGYLGFLGPVIRAAVGDTIKVVYRNTCPFPTSVHPHGVFYDKSSEGAPYADGTAQHGDDAVPTGGRWTYTWKVPERAGPGPGDGSSVMWMYHSHTDEVGDVYAGLTGPMVITRAGMARADGSPKDVDREVFLDFFIDNEAASPLLAANLHRFLRGPVPKGLAEDEGFEESSLKHSINGYLFGNMPMIDLRRGEHVRWYVMDMGTETDLHTPHWHGNDVTVNGMRMDVISLLPAGMVVADMVPDDAGTWLMHCHVHDHITAGMITRYRVTG